MNKTPDATAALQELRKSTVDGASFTAGAAVQITCRSEGSTRDGKPFYELTIADGTGSEKLRLWCDTPAYRLLSDYPQMGRGTAILMHGRWKQNQYGLNIESAQIRPLNPEEMNALYAGDPGYLARSEAAWQEIVAVFAPPGAGQGDKETGRQGESEGAPSPCPPVPLSPCPPMEPLARVCRWMLSRVEAPLRRAAAARGHHHARRGGLLEHTAGMLRTAKAVAACYPEIEPMLLSAAILFHDIGKIFETDYEAQGFALAPTARGALLGHIAIGAGMFDYAFRACHGEQYEELRDHVIHCILAHHGMKEWGSPVEPATPEAVAIHQIDMLDSRMDKLRTAYALPETAPGLVDSNRANYVKPFKTTATYARLVVAAVLEVDGENDPFGVKDDFCVALQACGITTNLMDFDELPRGMLDTAFRRWDELQAKMPGFPDLPGRVGVTPAAPGVPPELCAELAYLKLETELFPGNL